jgi:predicted enzyme related to lactoylglutathione lyase
VVEPFDIVDAGRSAALNGLNTRDVEGAKSFYGSVFGWGTLALDGRVEMWTLTGFGDFLERDGPEIRSQMGKGRRAGPLG